MPDFVVSPPDAIPHISNSAIVQVVAMYADTFIARLTPKIQIWQLDKNGWKMLH